MSGGKVIQAVQLASLGLGGVLRAEMGLTAGATGAQVQPEGRHGTERIPRHHVGSPTQVTAWKPCVQQLCEEGPI